DRVGRHVDDAAGAAHEVTHRRQLVAGVEDEVLDPLTAVVAVEVRVLVVRREVVSGVPRAALRGAAAELRSGDAVAVRRRGAQRRRDGVAAAVVAGPARGRRSVVPLEHGTLVLESVRTRDLLRAVAGI